MLTGSTFAVLLIGVLGILRLLLGMAGCITAIALLDLGLSVLLRSVGAVVGRVLVLPSIAGALLLDSWDAVLRFLPTSVASSFTAVASAGNSTLAAGPGAAVLAVWGVVMLGAVVLAIRRRDV